MDMALALFDLKRVLFVREDWADKTHPKELGPEKAS